MSDVEWSTPDHAHGSAADTPDHLRALEQPAIQVRELRTGLRSLRVAPDGANPVAERDIVAP